MRFKTFKTLHTLFQPEENGWTVVHKKYKTPFGRILCEMCGDAVILTMDFGVYTAEREEAAEAAVRAAFEADGTETVVLGGKSIRRAEWEAGMQEKYAALHKTRADYADVLGKPVHCVMDRPLGTAHPRYPDMIYPVNYGYVPGVIAGDQSEQDVYVLGPTEPLAAFDGVVIAVIHRFDDCEDKWVAAEPGCVYTEAEIRDLLHFQEKYYISEILM